MILFLADDHYGTRPGAALHDTLQQRLALHCPSTATLAARGPLVFAENNPAALEDPLFATQCDLLILNMIAETCGQPPVSARAEQNVRAYAEKGKPFLLLHGSSAAFWRADWWRAMVGLRWVRGEDPDGVAPSTHPVRPYRVEVSKCRHPLCQKLRPMDLPEDEIYTRLEQVCPTTTLLETTTAEGTFAQCWENATPWGGRVIGFLPGHKKEVAGGADVAGNTLALIDDLLA